MTGLEIDVSGWFGGVTDPDDATLGSLSIRVGDLPLTEVQDTIAETTRETIRVSAVRVAEWLLANWWRLRWEARPDSVTQAWRRAHSMAALGDGFAWPPLEIASDGEFVQLTLARERDADVAAIRYLRGDVTLEVTVQDFERAVERFVDKVESRISSVLPGERDLAALRAELCGERSEPAIARRCRWEARAGFDPGEAPEDWHVQVQRVAKDAGEIAIEDLLAGGGDGQELADVVDALMRAPTTVDLSGIPAVPAGANQIGARPWQHGVSAAMATRSALGIGPGPIPDATLTQLLGKKLPVVVGRVDEGQILGGYRARDDAGTTHVLVGSERMTSQRFYFARLIGLASHLPRTEQVLPITTTGTAMQKFGRSFAQEFLCPWVEIDAFTTEHGTGENAVARVAERYAVSEMLITTTLVNRGKLDRARIATYPA